MRFRPYTFLALTAFSAIWLSCALSFAQAPFSNGNQSATPDRYFNSGDVRRVAFNREAAGQAPSEQLSAKTIQAEIEALASQSELSDEEKEQASTKLRQALTWTKTAAEARAHINEYQTQIDNAPAATERFRQQLNHPPEPHEISVPPGAGLAQLEAKITDLEHIVEEYRQDLAGIDEQIDGRSDRISAIAKEIPELEKRLGEIDETTVAGGEGYLAHVQEIERSARKDGLKAQLQLLRTEKKRSDALAAQWPLEHDLATQRLEAGEEQLATWRKTVETWRRDESTRFATATRKLAERSHPALRSLAIRNAEIAETRVKTAKQIEWASAELAKVSEMQREVTDSYASLESKVEHAPEATSTGILLRKQRDELPSPKESWRRGARLAEDTPKAHLLLTELKDERKSVSRIDELGDELIAKMGTEAASADRDQVKRAVTILLQTRRDLLDKLIADQDTLLRDLSDLEVANQDLGTQLSEFRVYLDEHVLWVRSHEMVASVDLKQSAKAIVTILEPGNWTRVIRATVGETMRRPAALAAAFALLILAFTFRQRLVKWLQELCSPPKPGSPIRFGKSLKGLAISALLSAGWPTILLAIGYKLSTASAEGEFVQALGKSCLAVAALVWSCQLIREICMEGNVGHRMFGWPSEMLISIRRILELTVLVGAPLMAVLFLTGEASIPGGDSLHRLTLITMLCLVAFETYTVLRPSGSVMKAVTLANPESLLARLQRPVCFFAVVVPLVLAGFSVYGYHYSATQLSGRFAESLVGIAALVILHALALRWLRIKGYNRTVLEQQRAAEKRNQAVDHESSSAAMAAEIAKADEIDFQQTADNHIRELLRYVALITLCVGGWFIWSQVLPALGVLDRVVLWENMVRVSEVVSDPSGKTTLQHFDTNVPTTLKDGLLALLIVVVTLRIGNQLTSFFEVTLSDRLPIDRGARHAIAILVRYAATIAGLLTACYVIQLSWGKVQWLAAAMTVGLGFGLQEIFANLVSGLIILFERPIRAGDVVTVGDVTGTVSRMQMRATTITDFDRRELIVPNRKFITDNVINWTLTDPICRAIVPVGVAYGTDTDQLTTILLNVAKRSPLVLDNPSSNVVFSGFGDSTLDFELRVFISHREEMPETTSQLNIMINRELNKAGIEIAFPQQDLHLRSVDPALRQNIFADAQDESVRSEKAA